MEQQDKYKHQLLTGCLLSYISVEPEMPTIELGKPSSICIASTWKTSKACLLIIFRELSMIIGVAFHSCDSVSQFIDAM